MADLENRVLLFGAGELGRLALESLPQSFEVISFIDNDRSKIGQSVNGVPINPPSFIIHANFDYIILSSSYFHEIFEQLMSLGVAKEKILPPQLSTDSSQPIQTQVFKKFYSEVDDHGQKGDLMIDKNLLRKYVHCIDYHPKVDLIMDLNKISMLSPQVLLLLSFLAKSSSGRILEIGPYTGGSTIALASGIKERNREKIISIEVGGKYLNHPQIPSKDIISDFNKNLRKFNFENQIRLFQGWSNEPHIIQAVEKEIGSETIGLLFIDADGNVERDFSNYGKYLRTNSFIFLDDYSTEDAPEKETLVKSWVEKNKRLGVFDELGVFPWGTWIGTLRTNIWKF